MGNPVFPVPAEQALGKPHQYPGFDGFRLLGMPGAPVLLSWEVMDLEGGDLWDQQCHSLAMWEFSGQTYGHGGAGKAP